MLDNDGYRLGIGIVIYRHDKKLLWCKRKERNAWQFPQGGIEQGETPEEAMWRELQEEVGLLPQHTQFIQAADQWFHYELPKELRTTHRGQKQKWFLLKLLISDNHINLTAANEFEQWCWVDRHQPLQEIVAFKRETYRQVLESFALVKQ